MNAHKIATDKLIDLTELYTAALLITPEASHYAPGQIVEKALNVATTMMQVGNTLRRQAAEADALAEAGVLHPDEVELTRQSVEDLKDEATDTERPPADASGFDPNTVKVVVGGQEIKPFAQGLEHVDFEDTDHDNGAVDGADDHE